MREKAKERQEGEREELTSGTESFFFSTEKFLKESAFARPFERKKKERGSRGRPVVEEEEGEK